MEGLLTVLLWGGVIALIVMFEDVIFSNYWYVIGLVVVIFGGPI